MTFIHKSSIELLTKWLNEVKDMKMMTVITIIYNYNPPVS